MKGFEVRGLEFHSGRMWRHASVERALEFMERFGLNTLIFHQVDLIDALVLPAAFFDEDLSWERWPVRYATASTRRAYIRRVIEEAEARGIAFFLEVKELWYPEPLLELLPDLRTEDGVVCPTDPFWMEFLSIRLKELFEELPGIAGLIISPATRESKVSISNNRCGCERCASVDPAEWYRTLIRVMFDELDDRGKTLVVRDFSYTVAQQDLVLDAAASVSGGIVAGLKNVPHDFWPTFPDNPRIGRTSGLRQWIEYDAWGQFCGLGVFPVDLVSDMRRRMRSNLERGTAGVWFRTDWEVLDEASVFNSFNIVNLIGGAMLAKNPDTGPDEVYAALAEYGLYSPLSPESRNRDPVLPRASDAPDRLRSFMEASWAVIEKTLYLRGHVFSYSSRFHHSIAEIEKIMITHQGREQWDPDSGRLVSLSDLSISDANARAILEEKRLACEEAERLGEILGPETLGLPDEFAAELRESLDLYSWYVRGFFCQAEIYVAVRLAQSDPRLTAEAAGKIGTLVEFRRSLEERLSGTRHPYYLYWMMNPRDLELFERDAIHALAPSS